MKRSYKRILCISALAFLLGCVLVMSAFLMIGFDFLRLDSRNMVKTEQVIEGEFSDIEISNLQQDLRVVASPDGVCRISYYGNERLSVATVIEDGVLRIVMQDMRDWQDYINIVSASDETAVLYLPAGNYGALRVKAGASMDLVLEREICLARLEAQISSGNIDSLAQITDGVDIKGSSGRLHLENISGGNVTIEDSSGDVVLKHCRAAQTTLTLFSGSIELVDVSGEILATTSSGDIVIEDAALATLTLKTSSGDVELKRTVVQTELRIETSTGDIKMERSDAAHMILVTGTGDMELELLRGKGYYVKTGTGSVSHPEHDTNGGLCNVTTSTGDVMITVVDPIATQ